MKKKKIPEQVKLIQEFLRPKFSPNDGYISYSQFLSYQTCPHQWYLTYVKKLGLYSPSIHTVFGTAMHETLQEWIKVMYDSTKSLKEVIDMDLSEVLLDRMYSVYKQEKARSGHEHFSNPDELNEFWKDGVAILEYVKKKRKELFVDRKNGYLVGVEIPLLYCLKPNIYFKGFIDLVFYHDVSKKFYIIDFKTSTSGWNDDAKKDDKKIAQLILYKQFFAKQFHVDIDKIEIEYVILKRKVPANPEFASMGRRTQSFIPSSGKIKTTYIQNKLNEFIQECFHKDGNYVDKDYEKNASKSNCMFCQFRENKFLCNQAVL